VSLEAEGENQEAFKLLMKTKKSDNKMQVPGMNVIQIPFSFVPREISCYECTIAVAMNDKIQWKYPIKGVTESVSNTVLYNFKTKCREKFEDEFRVYLQGISHLNGPDDTFTFEFENVPAEL